MKRILHLIQRPQNRGAETFACQLATHQSEMGYEVKMISVFPGNANLPWENEIFILNGSVNNRFFDHRAWKRLANEIAKFKPDVVQANAGDTLKYAVFSKTIYKWKAPIIFRNASEVGKYLNSRIHKVFNWWLYKNVDLVISVSQASKTDLINHFLFLKNKVHVIPIGIEDQVLAPNVNLLNQEEKHIIHVGGFTFEKNHIGLIRIFKKVQHEYKNVHLHLLGDGPLRNAIEKDIENNKLKSKISLYGFVNNPLDFIKSGDLLVLPSIIEGLPGVILEAMYCKTPAIAYNVGGISEVLNENTGKLIESDNEVEFANAVLKTLREPNAAQVERAYNYVIENFLNKNIAKDFIRIYERIL